MLDHFAWAPEEKIAMCGESDRVDISLVCLRLF